MSSNLNSDENAMDADHTEVAIRISNVSKVYQVYDRPVDRLKQSILPRVKRLAGLHSEPYYQEFWALKDISFEVKKGETIGIIGRNGAGKSTLLQIICGTLSPSSGDVEVNGRAAALLELGSGFNPEFTGRENVYINALILGLTEEEIDSKYDAIVAFADIGDFIEQPVKSYSSGMLVRLAFAVIAHVDADILVIDEALAVGDVFFTQKCMRFLKSFMETGTVLFVSHDTSAVTSLCEKAILLEKGSISHSGTAEKVVRQYVNTTIVQGVEETLVHQVETKSVTSVKMSGEQIINEIGYFKNIENSEAIGTGQAEITKIEFFDTITGLPLTLLHGGERLTVKIFASTSSSLKSTVIGFFIKNRLGQSLFGETTFNGKAFGVDARTDLCATFKFELPYLPNGEYSMTVSIADGDLGHHIHHHWVHDAVVLRINSSVARFGLVGIKFQQKSLEIK